MKDTKNNAPKPGVNLSLDEGMLSTWVTCKNLTQLSDQLPRELYHKKRGLDRARPEFFTLQSRMMGLEFLLLGHESRSRPWLCLPKPDP